MKIEPNTKKLLAIVLIIVAGVGLSIGAYFWIFAPKPYGAVVTGQLVTPGAPDGTPSNQILIVGVLDPMTEIQGEGAWQGAYLACDKINTAGGVIVNGTQYYFGLVSEDTFEADAVLDTAKGLAAAQKIITQDNARYIIGGFRTEAVAVYIEEVMDEKMLFLGTGASTDSFCQNVLDNYSRYQYWFRLMPINSTSLATELIKYVVYVCGYMSAALGRTINKTAILREDLDWTIPLAAGLKGALPGYGLEVVAEIAYPITAEAADFATYWSQINANGTQVCIPAISAQGGILMTTQYAATQPKCLIAGIDVMSQLDNYWDETGGACNYEVILQSTIRTNKTTKTIAFWDEFVGKYGNEPLYTAVGSYDAMYALLEAINQSQSLNSTELVPVLEAINTANSLEGVAGNLAFTSSHDLFEGYDAGGTEKIWGVTLFTQWQAGGTKECVTSGGLVYPEYVVTDTLDLPSWGIN